MSFMMIKFIQFCVLLFAFCFASCVQKTKYTKPTIEIQTNFGDIIVELYPEKAPNTVAAFLGYIDSGYYKNTSFYRVLKAEDQPSSAPKSDLIQGGMWQTNYKKQLTIPGIQHETTQATGILHKDGVISLARTAPGTASTEFFICIGNQPNYDYGGSANPDKQGFAAFGKVIKGMDVVKQIHQQPDNETSFTPAILIKNIKRL
jgi:peptidyl-prolyl cis-trans isomerase A (cyclophilin A)